MTTPRRASAGARRNGATRKPTRAGGPAHERQSDLAAISVFIAGKLYDNLGAFFAVAADPIYGGVGLDQSDIRYADNMTLFGKDTIWGIDVNNSPTVEDPWNTTPSWGCPQIYSTIAPAFSPPLTRIERRLRQRTSPAPACTRSGTTWCTRRSSPTRAFPTAVQHALNRQLARRKRDDQPRALLASGDRTALGRSLPDGRHVRHVRPARARTSIRLSERTTTSTSASTRNISTMAISTA